MNEPFLLIECFCEKSVACYRFFNKFTPLNLAHEINF